LIDAFTGEARVPDVKNPPIYVAEETADLAEEMERRGVRRAVLINAVQTHSLGEKALHVNGDLHFYAIQLARIVADGEPIVITAPVGSNLQTAYVDYLLAITGHSHSERMHTVYRLS
jgi:hypothetical protein